jgi:hypothetical protein
MCIAPSKAGEPSRRKIGKAKLRGLTQRESIITGSGHGFPIRPENRRCPVDRRTK